MIRKCSIIKEPARLQSLSDGWQRRLAACSSCGTINECHNLSSSLFPREMPACSAVEDDADPTS